MLCAAKQRRQFLIVELLTVLVLLLLVHTRRIMLWNLKS